MAGSRTYLTAMAAGLIAAATWTSGAAAQQHPVHDCKPELVKATGAATILGMGRARRLAINNWQREVRQKYGERFMDFTHARAANSECESASIGTIGQLNKRCTVVGYPCAPGTPGTPYVEWPPVPPGPPPGPGGPQYGNFVCDAQRALIRLRYLSGDQYDCEFGPITSTAVGRFQRDNGLPRTGQLDPPTMERLRQLTGGRAG